MYWIRFAAVWFA